MPSLGLIVDGLVLFCSLSREGKTFLWKWRKAMGKGDGGASAGFFRDPGDRRLVFRNLKACDRNFRRWLPEQAATKVGKTKLQLYARLVPFAWANLEFRTRLLQAFDVSYDRAAEDRCVMFTFAHRDWNDLFDSGDFPLDELYRIYDPPETAPPRLYLLKALGAVLDKLVPRDDFPNYWALVDRSREIVTVKVTKENVAAVTAERSEFGALLNAHIMVNEIPDQMKEALKPLSMWLYSLDDLSDLENDAAEGRPNRMALVGDPEQEIHRLYAECEKHLARLATNPASLLRFMKSMSDLVLQSRRDGVDVEKHFMGGD